MPSVVLNLGFPAKGQRLIYAPTGFRSMSNASGMVFPWNPGTCMIRVFFENSATPNLTTIYSTKVFMAGSKFTYREHRGRARVMELWSAK